MFVAKCSAKQFEEGKQKKKKKKNERNKRKEKKTLALSTFADTMLCLAIFRMRPECVECNSPCLRFLYPPDSQLYFCVLSARP